MFLITAISLATAAQTFKDYPVPQDCLMQSQKEGKLHIYDWAEWWPEEIYKNFEKKYGIEIVRDNFASDDEYMAKFKLNPNAPYDVMLPSSRGMIQLKALGILSKLNKEWIPNAVHYLPAENKKIWYDPNNEYGIPTDRYFYGYAYNTKFVDSKDPRIGSWALVYEGKEYQGRMTMLDEMFAVIGNALKYLGYSYNSNTKQELMKAGDLLIKQKPWVMAYDSWPKRLIMEQEAWVSNCWVGDSYFYYKELDTIRGSLPKEGTELGMDPLVIPRGAPHPAAAHLFINYIMSPEVNTTLILGIGYSPNHNATQQLVPEEFKKWPGTIPSEEYLQKCEIINEMALTGQGLELRSKIWEELKR
jgi:spermidine/putrescine transport system substrate-binding protein